MNRLMTALLVASLLLLATTAAALGGQVRLVLGDTGWPVWATAVYLGGAVYQGSEFNCADGSYSVHVDTALGAFTIPVVVRPGAETVVRLPLPHPFDAGEFRRLASEKGALWRWNRRTLSYYVVQKKARHRRFQSAVDQAFTRIAQETGGLFRFTPVQSPASADLVVNLVTEKEIAPQFPGDPSVPAGYVDPRPCYWVFTRIDLYVDVRYCLDPAVLKHEIAHSLGLMGHASKPTALMHETCTAATDPCLSAEEVTALRVLYSLKAGEAVLGG